MSIKVLSLCDGIGGAAEALRQLGVKADYYHSEIDTRLSGFTGGKHEGFHKMEALGPVGEACESVDRPDLMVFGSPCTSFSVAGKLEEFDDPRGQLLIDCIKIMRKVKPKYFLIENVASMRKPCKEYIDSVVGVTGIMIDSAFFSAQRRKRYYWTNIPRGVKGPVCEDVLGDVIFYVSPPFVEKFAVSEKLAEVYRLLEDGQNWRDLPDDNPEKMKIVAAATKYTKETGKNPGGRTGYFKLYDKKAKSPTLTASGLKQSMTRFVFKDYDGNVRYPTPMECASLQGFPRWYCDGLTHAQQYHAYGNAFNVPTIKAFLRNIV